jgi:NAD(P)H dehydrogenase (quinone)
MERGGLEVKVKRVGSASLGDLTNADAIVLGSPTYFGNMSGNMKQFVDKSIELYPDKLNDKVGAAFTSYGGDGDYTTLLSLIVAMFFHQMIIVGHQSGVIGAVSIEKPGDKCIAECQVFGERIADFTKAIAKK